MKSTGGKSRPNRNCKTHTEERWTKTGCKKCGLYDAGGPGTNTKNGKGCKEKRCYVCPVLTALLASHPAKRKARGTSKVPYAKRGTQTGEYASYIQARRKHVSYLAITPRKEDLDPTVSYFYSQHTALSNILYACFR